MSLDTQALLEAIQEAIKGDLTEATVRIRIEGLLSSYLSSIGVNYQSVHERTVSSGGRSDALFGTVVIEYKRPGRLGRSSEFRNAIEQLERYLEAESAQSGLAIDRYAGILMDGRSLAFLRRAGAEWSVAGPEPINLHNLRLALEYLRGLSRKPLDPKLLAQDFGPGSDVSRHCIISLWNGLEKLSGKTQMLFEEWQHLFGQVAGYESRQIPELAEMEKEFGIETTNEMPRFLFALHTYYALIIKLLAVEILTTIRQGLEHSFLEKAAIISPTELRDLLVSLENGGIFRNLQIENLLEGDFFSWYLDQWNNPLSDAIHQIIVTLREYESSTTILAPERVKDLLKRLYQYLVPATLRHDLGEYYTPDWLAEYVLNKLGYDGDLNLRILDPACGTATFLILAINRAKARAEEQHLPKGKVLGGILKNIVGMDLNPLAVVAARTNYLLCLGDLLNYQEGPITIPIYLSDSIFSPSRKNTIYGEVCEYVIKTKRGSIQLSLPVELIAEDQISALLAEIENCVTHHEIDEEECLQRVSRRLRLKEAQVEQFGNQIKNLYRQISNLEQKNWNRIWTRIIKNYYASAAIGEFDIIAGNPPWLRWTRLPESYRETIKTHCREYGLFSDDFYVGGIETDISTILTYSAAAKWLKPGGKLGFLITQTVFKSESSQGFRKFKLPDGTSLRVLEVDDMVALNPFQVKFKGKKVKNRTAALFLIKSASTVYPVPYAVWRKKRGARLEVDSTLQEVMSVTERTQLVATPLYPEGGPWLTLPSEAWTALRGILGHSRFQARKGVDTDLNGVYWIQVLRNRPDGLLEFRNMSKVGRKKVKQFEGLIEPEVVYPLVRGRNTAPFYAEFSDMYLIVPQKGMRGYPEELMREKYPHALDYFRNYRRSLEERSSYRRFHAKGGWPYYSLWNLGPYTFTHHKVVWREIQSGFFASYLGSRRDPFLGESVLIPDHKLMMVPCRSAMEAHYLCGFLNSSIVKLVVEGYAVSTEVGTHVTEYINIPDFDPKNGIHLKLADLSLKVSTRQEAPSQAEQSQIDSYIEQIVA